MDLKLTKNNDFHGCQLSKRTKPNLKP